ncbi:MAG: NifB/NifX family molybdenum-iron cluster-binding protein [Bacteroidales bacterium]|nr:NifB/NifX family molybdenum-iron cluster-binding protein [Bacteroidales bacterium]
MKIHFGDADRYLIYTLESGSMKLSSEEVNKFKSLNEEHEHGSIRKGNAIIKFLKEKDVNVLVSTQFGKNISLVNKHFIPLKISLEQQDEILDILKKHQHWIMDEWENNSSGYKLFTIKSGILKSSIDR